MAKHIDPRVLVERLKTSSSSKLQPAPVDSKGKDESLTLVQKGGGRNIYHKVGKFVTQSGIATINTSESKRIDFPTSFTNNPVVVANATDASEGDLTSLSVSLADDKGFSVKAKVVGDLNVDITLQWVAMSIE